MEKGGRTHHTPRLELMSTGLHKCLEATVKNAEPVYKANPSRLLNRKAPHGAQVMLEWQIITG